MANAENERIVVLIDMDCFFCQVETKFQPDYAGKPLAVVQYNQWQLGGIIAVNYEAREFGVTRHMRGEEAKEKCPNIVLASVPCLRGKADTSRYRSAGREVIDVIRNHCNIIERASVDEAYLDITDIVDKRMSANYVSVEQLTAKLSNTFVVGYSEVGRNDEEERSQGTRTWVTNAFQQDNNIKAQRLAVAGLIVEELRADIFVKTGFRCSAGIAQNKILAKLACGLHKPNRQTILPASAVETLYSTLPVKKVRNLGGKFGDVVVESLNCNVMGDLLQYSLEYLQKRFDDKTGLWLYNIARGIDNEPVTIRLLSKSIGACKKFPGKQAITSLDVLQHWAGELSAEVCERLEQDLVENKRRATLSTVCFHYYQNKTIVSQSRSYALNSYKAEKMATRCVDIICKSTQCPVAYIGISAGKFIPAKGSQSFRNFFKANKLVACQEINVLTRNTETDSYSANNTNEQIANNLEVHKIANTDIIQNPRISAQVNEQSPNVKTDLSPTSRRLNSLINSFNERNAKKSFCGTKTNNCNLNDSLDQNDFKESFFMNVFNSKESNMNDEYPCNTEPLELNEHKNIDIECENLNKITKIDKENNYDGISNLSKIESQSKKGIEDVETTPSCSNVNVSPNNNANNSQHTIKLKEIFPDLNNIDHSIVALLPLDLQEEAKLYMKLENRKETAKEVLTKVCKGKNKSKRSASKGKKNSDISNFLVKRNLGSDATEIPFKQCLQCYQMIAVSKYLEHCDFHVAESLQMELNNSMLQTAGVKRKISIDDTNEPSENSHKRRMAADTLKMNKNHKSITSFLS